MKRTTLVDGHKLLEEVTVAGKDENVHQMRLLKVQLRSALAVTGEPVMLLVLMREVLVGGN